MHSNAISDDKIFLAATILKNKKACARDGIPPEYWKCFCNKSITRMWAVKLCNAIWNHNEIPDSWHDALATAGFKQGDVSLRANYQPIPLLSIGHKCFCNRAPPAPVKGRRVRVWMRFDASLNKPGLHKIKMVSWFSWPLFGPHMSQTWHHTLQEIATIHIIKQHP